MRRALSMPVLPRPQSASAASAATLPSLRGRVHPLQEPARPPPSAFRGAGGSPLVVTANPLARSQLLGPNRSADPAHRVPLNRTAAYPFETDTFGGRAWIFFRGLPLPNCQAPASSALFPPGTKRLFHVVVQGSFRRRVAASSFCVGQEFLKPGNAPSWVGDLVLSAAARTFSSSARVEAKRGGAASFMNPVLAASQLVNVVKKRRGEEEEEDGLSWIGQEEDVRLWAPELSVDGVGGNSETAAPMPAEQRRRWCDCASNLEGRYFEADPELVWTFHIYQHLVDFADYRLRLVADGGVGGERSSLMSSLWASLANVDLAPALDRQPLQLTLKDVDADEYAFSLLCWHERLLYPDAASAAEVEVEEGAEAKAEAEAEAGAGMVEATAG